MSKFHQPTLSKDRLVSSSAKFIWRNTNCYLQRWEYQLVSHER